jgi:hypothetical protein
LRDLGARLRAMIAASDQVVLVDDAAKFPGVEVVEV